MQRWIVKMVAPALAVTLCAGMVAFAQPAVDEAGKAGNVERRAARIKRAGKQKGGPVVRQIKLLETALGAPLTEQQKADIRTAHETYQASVAKSLGLTADELQAKLKEARQKARAARQDAKPAKARRGTKADAAAVDAPAAVDAQ
ncbi:MAG TPA: hypothetical protein VNA16_11550 [Abditibacteriaceae bacterium]|nr:hypothetical protein [Abditibacteriaceae bacterium]